MKILLKTYLCLLLFITTIYSMAQNKQFLAVVSYDSMQKNMPESIYLECWQYKQVANLEVLTQKFKKLFHDYQGMEVDVPGLSQRVEAELLAMRTEIEKFEKTIDSLLKHKQDSIKPLVRQRIQNIIKKVAQEQHITLVINSDTVKYYATIYVSNLSQIIIEEDTTIYDSVEQMPTWTEELKPFYRYLRSNLSINKSDTIDISDCHQLLVSFVVEKNGTVTNIALSKPNPCVVLHEIITIFQQLPKLTVGRHHGYKKRVKMIFPIHLNFR